MHSRIRHLGTITLVFVATTLLVACAGSAPATQSSAEKEPPATAQAQSEEASAAGDESREEAKTGVKLNLNMATSDEYLDAIPGFGNRMVREFLEYRPYISIQQFRREIGKYVDETQVAEYEHYVFVPVDVNESDAETLKQLSDVDDEVAADLMAARPFDSEQAFLDKLAELAPDADLEMAEAYLIGE